MIVGSLFSGIGGIDLGLERAGMRVLWQVECDPYARAVLRKHWPDAALYDDVRGVGAANLAPVDLVCGGFPCQDISNAGKRVGIEGERSGLWAEYARIVRELRPRYVLVENVAALLARGLQRVVGDLAACGYDAEWDCFPASAFGAPHQRDRLFVVAHAVREPSGLQSEPELWRGNSALAQHDGEARAVADAAGEGLERRSQPKAARATQRKSADHGGAVAYAPRNGREQGRQGAREDVWIFGGGGNAPPRNDWWDVEPDVGRVAYGVPSRVDRLRCLGNAVVPQVAEWIGRQILAHAEGA